MNPKYTAIITGGTSGLGFETVKVLDRKGWRVATCGRRNAIIERIKKDSDNRILAEVCDIRIDSSISLFLGKVEDAFKGIDVLVLNAADIGPVPLPTIENLETRDLRMTFETNFFGNFNFLKLALPLMRDGGIVVHITSDAAKEPYPGWAAYSSSKAAFDILIKILNEELKARRIKAFSFDPGDMNTAMHHLAIPDDRSPLKDPKVSAEELFMEIRKRVGEHDE